MQNIRLVKVLSVGTSLGVILPAEVLRGLEIERGDRLALAVYGTDSIVLGKVTPELLTQLKPPIIHV